MTDLPPPAGDAAPRVRFDSLDPRGARSFRFDGLVRVLRADRLDEVVPVLRAAEAAAAEGRHAAGFVAYEAAPAFDPALAVKERDPRLPLAWFAVYERRHAVASDALDSPDPSDAETPALGPWTADVDEAAYRDTLARIRGWIAAGDTYQVNYTLRLRAPFAGDDEALYRRLCRAQRAAYCAHLRLDGRTSVVSASPELFFRLSRGELELRPMKGTRARGRWPEEDAALAAELAASPKDRAENLMIVDLLRNDAGRLAPFGGVRVERMFEVERYETVHQMTSTIRAAVRPGTSLAEVFGALFPCGSVTGAPKVRTTQLIAEVEPGPRGVYCGAVGFVSPGEAAFSVAIRTLLVDRGAGTAELGVGSGVTHDSDAGDEYRECLAKAAFAVRAPNDFRLLETLRWEPDGGFARMDGHLARLARSAAYFGFRCDPAAVRRALEDAVSRRAADAGRRVRLTLDRAGRVEIGCAPLPPPEEGPVRLAFAAEPVDSAEPLLYHKTTRRDAYERRLAAHPGCDDVLLVNERGEVTEATIANVVVRMDGSLWTPPLASGLLPGVLRAELLARGDIAERILTRDDVLRAEEVWLVSSLRGWRRAGGIES